MHSDLYEWSRSAEGEKQPKLSAFSLKTREWEETTSRTTFNSAGICPDRGRSHANRCQFYWLRGTRQNLPTLDDLCHKQLTNALISFKMIGSRAGLLTLFTHMVDTAPSREPVLHLRPIMNDARQIKQATKADTTCRRTIRSEVENALRSSRPAQFSFAVVLS